MKGVAGNLQLTNLTSQTVIDIRNRWSAGLAIHSTDAWEICNHARGNFAKSQANLVDRMP